MYKKSTSRLPVETTDCPSSSFMIFKHENAFLMSLFTDFNSLFLSWAHCHMCPQALDLNAFYMFI